VIEILEEILQILQFIHSHGIIHRDIKPPNIIQRQSDGHLVLIDFGVVKNIQQMGDREEATSMTMAVGTRGYISPEQSNGQPRPNSDIYSLGMMAIQAVTGIPSEDLVQQRDPHTGELIWHKHAFVSQALIQILDRMVRFNFTERYQSAAEVLADLQPLIELYRSDPADPDFPAAESREVDEEDDSASEPTQLWQDASDLDVALPETDPSPEDSEPLDSTQKTEDSSTEATQPWISEEHSATDLPPTSPADPPSAAQD
jgi:serine/threonine-protein kinase